MLLTALNVSLCTHHFFLATRSLKLWLSHLDSLSDPWWRGIILMVCSKCSKYHNHKYWAHEIKLNVSRGRTNHCGQTLEFRWRERLQTQGHATFSWRTLSTWWSPMPSNWHSIVFLCTDGHSSCKYIKWTCLMKWRPPAIDDSDAVTLVALNGAARGFHSSCAPTETHWYLDRSFVCSFLPSYWLAFPSRGTYLTVPCSTWGGLQLFIWHGWRKQLMQERTKESRTKVMRGNQNREGKGKGNVVFLFKNMNDSWSPRENLSFEAFWSSIDGLLCFSGFTSTLC